ncbi:unnamed protein product, partial [Iphiclides podalirius]
MARVMVILIGFLTIHNFLCAPSEAHDKLGKEKRELENDEPKLNDQPYSLFESDDTRHDKKVQGPRQKRWYDNIPYNYPPPFYRPYDTSSELESSLLYIRSSLEDILRTAKSTPPPPPPSFYPVFVPIYIPQVACGCNPNNNEEPTTKAPEQPAVTEAPKNETVPGLHDRFPEMEDDRQNWGLLINNTVSDYDDDDDGSRPISLGTIAVNDNNGVPAPSVDHGSVQADINNLATQELTSLSPPRVLPSTVDPLKRICDDAVLSCCLGPEKSFRCIQSRGCQDKDLRDTPCDPQRILATITRLQSYYS